MRATRADRAKDLTIKTIEKIVDPAAPPEQRIQRRGRLTKEARRVIAAGETAVGDRIEPDVPWSLPGAAAPLER